MKLGDLKIGVRLGLLGAFFFVALAIVATGGWRALDSSTAHSAQALQRSLALSQAIDTARSAQVEFKICLLYTSPSPRDRQKSRMPSCA